ncbi:MAG TPA: methyltransferase domain-containing protein [Anaerolineales bacterium]|nr:methyltransferase domain-containing protein [Anaerolineales bacterium]
MTDAQKDMWSQWLLSRRFGGDSERMKRMFGFLYPIRDEVLSHIDLEGHGTLLDVGCGDGLIAFGALEKFGSCRVIFSDISEDLLNHAEALAREMNVQDRCQFVCASADDLFMINDNAIDAVTTRSVLIYVSAKQKSFNEFHRVLKAGGVLSIFEPINRFAFPEPPNRFSGFDVTPVADLAQKIVAIYQRIQPDTDPMVDFDERDLVAYAERAGFSEVHLELRIEVKPLEAVHHSEADWSAFLHTAGNPKVPTLAEAMLEALTPAEAEKFTNYLRPLVEAGRGTRRSARAYLWAVK